MATYANRNASAPEGYDSVVLAAEFTAEGITDGAVGSHYDYKCQAWRDGHDHAHVDEACRLSPLFCGADVLTCQGGE